MPMTGFADVAAGSPSLVMRVIGTSMAIVLMLTPLKRLIPNALTLSLSSPGPVKQRQISPQVERVEHRAEIDVERLGALAREDADAGRRIGVDALRGERRRSWETSTVRRWRAPPPASSR